MRRNSATGYAMVALAATLFAINGTVSKVILGSGIDSQQLTEMRCAGALVGLMLIALATRPKALPLRSDELHSSSRRRWARDCPVVVLLCDPSPRDRDRTGDPVRRVDPCRALWARFVYHERLRARIGLALALALVGLVLMVEL